MSFAGDLQRFSSKTKIRWDLVVKKVCIDLNSDLVRITPVDTGMARSNWFTGDSRITSIDQTLSTNGAPSIKRAAEFASTLKAGGVFFITNNLPYILELEYGSSKQAPAGMARITVDRWQETVNRIVGGIR